jgi:hypothetical protein
MSFIFLLFPSLVTRLENNRYEVLTLLTLVFREKIVFFKLANSPLVERDWLLGEV